MTEIATEDDLWKLFFVNPPKDGFKQQGDGAIHYSALRQVLEAKSFGKGHEQLRLTDESRFYLLTYDLPDSRRSTAVVCQRDLRSSARAFMGLGDGFVVAYLGSSRDTVSPYPQR